MQSNKLAEHILLHTDKTAETDRDLFKIAIRFAKYGHKVIYVRTKPFEELPIGIDANADSTDFHKDVMRNIYFHYHKTSSELVPFLLGIHKTKVKPRVIIIDFIHTFFENDLASLTSGATTSTGGQQQHKESELDCIMEHMKLTATIHDTINTMTKQFEANCFSIVCMNTQFHPIYPQFVQKYVDFYYYQPNVIYSDSCDLVKAIEDKLAAMRK